MRIVLVAALAALALAGCSSDPEPPAEPESFDLRVTAQIAPKFVTPIAGGCDSNGVSKGSPVLVRDESNTTVGAGALGGGSLQPDGACHFYANITVAEGREFYEVTIGDRAPATVPADRARTGFSLSFGY